MLSCIFAARRYSQRGRCSWGWLEDTGLLVKQMRTEVSETLVNAVETRFLIRLSDTALSVPLQRSGRGNLMIDALNLRQATDAPIDFLNPWTRPAPSLRQHPGSRPWPSSSTLV